MPSKSKSRKPMIRDAGGPRQSSPKVSTMPHAVAWRAADQARLGTVPDAVIARAKGCSNEAVRRERARLGVPAHRHATRWTDELRGALADGSSIAAVAKRLGVSETAVRVARSRFGVAEPRRR